jgi:hypothetical protein
LARVNKLDAVNIQTKYIATVVCVFLAAAVSLNIVKTFENSGISLVADRDVIFCTIRPEREKRLLVPLASTMPEIPIGEFDESHTEEVNLFVDECAELLYNLNGDEIPPEETE